MPADDLTDPAPATTFAHLDATTVLSRAIAELGIYPAVDPLDSTSRIMDPNIIGEEHYKIARGVQKILQDYKSLQDIIAILGISNQNADTVRTGCFIWNSDKIFKKLWNSNIADSISNLIFLTLFKRVNGKIGNSSIGKIIFL